MSHPDGSAPPGPEARARAAEDALRFLAEGSWLRTGEDFFHALARFLASRLDLDFVCIDRLEGDALTAETVAVWADGGFQDNVCYALRDTPCGAVVGKALCTFQAGVRHQFPKDAVLQELGAEGYAGASLWSTDGRVIGLIALIRNRPFKDLGPVEAVLGLVAQRAAAELEVREATAARARSEALLGLAFDASPMGMVLSDHEGRVVRVNPAFCALVGRTAAELAPLRWQDLTHPDDVAASRASLEELLASERGTSCITKRYLRPDGSVVWTEVHASLMRTAGNGPLHVVAQVVDLTDRKAAEAALSAQEAKTTSMLRTALDGVWLLDQHAKFLEVNEAACSMLGYTRDELLQMGVADVEVEESPEETARHARRVNKQGADLFTSTHRRKDGTTFPVEVSVTALSKDGQLVAYVRDITERIRAEASLREREEWFRTLFNTMHEGFAFHEVICNEAGEAVDYRYLDLNSAFEHLTGLTREATVGRTVREVLPQIEEDWIQCFGRVALTGIPDGRESYVQDLDRYYRARAYSLEKGKFAVVFEETTVERRAQRELERREALYNNLVETSTDLVWRCDSQGLYTFINPAFERVLGYSLQEMLGHRFTEFMSPEQAERDRAMFARLLADNGRLVGYETVHLHKDGTPVDLVFSATCYHDEAGAVVGTQGTAHDITERKRSEAERAEQEDLLRLSLQGANLGAWDWDIASGDLTVNDRWLEMLGLGREEVGLSAGTWQERVHPTDLAQVEASLQAHLRGETPAYESEHRLRHASGDWVWVRDRGRVIKRGPSGEPLRMCGTHLDLTDGKWAALVEAARVRLIEFALTHSLDELLQATVDEACALTDSPIGFYHLVEDEQQTIVLHAWSTRTEREFCTAQGKGSHYPLAQAGVWADCLRERRAVIHNDYAALPHRKGLPEGHAPVIRELVVPLFRAGVVVAILGVGNKSEAYRDRDLDLVQRLIDHVWSIVERKRADENREALRRRLELAKASAHLGVWDWDVHSGDMTWDDQMLEIYGMARAELTNSLEDWRCRVHPEDLPRAEASVQAALAGEVPLNMTFRILRPDGATAWIKSDGLVDRDATGRPTRMVGINQDITEAFLAEEGRTQLQRQLAQSQKMESLGNLAGGVAHDLNNVLGAILSLSSAMRARVLPPDPMATSLDTITKACVRGRDVVRNLLLFARRGLEQEHPVELNALVHDLVSLLSHTTLQRVELVMELEEGLLPVLADGSALSHAVMNLCVNAVDAMPGGGTLTLATRRTEDGGQALVVRDTGTGMPEEVLAKAMDPFFTTKAPGKGTGLGLAMAYGTLQAHGGTLAIHSEVGVGTEITLTLPAARVQPAAPEPTAAPPVTPSSGMRMRILLVDDDLLVRESTGILLQTLGHTVHAAASGMEALEALSRGLEVDLAILDMNMPGLTGAETLPRLRELRPQLAVMVATGFADEETQDLPARFPRVRVIEKPYELSEIHRQMAELLVEGMT